MRFRARGRAVRAVADGWVGRVALVIAGASLIVGAACSGDDDDGADPPRSTTSADQATTTTQPQASGEDQQAAFTAIESLVLEATDLTDKLLQDPSLAAGDDSADVDRLHEIYTDDSPTPSEVLARLDSLASKGQSIQAGASGVFREFMVHGMAAVDATTVRFNFCANQDQETVDDEGVVIDRFAEVSQGTGEARWIDGRWRFYGLNRDEDTSIPTEPGQALPGFCQSLYGDEGEA
jgi:hypothetical protein